MQRVFDVDTMEVDFLSFSGGRLNASFNCIDRHLSALGNQTAIIWVQDEPGVYTRISYSELKHHIGVAQNANVVRGGIGFDAVVGYIGNVVVVEID